MTSSNTLIVVTVIGMFNVLLLALVNNWITSRKEKRDYARQDLVADRVATAARQTAEAAQLLVDAQASEAKARDEVARLAAAATVKITEKLNEIHILVNSDMTAARTNERDQTRLTLIATRRVQALSTKLGLPVDDAEQRAIEASEKRITELDQILADRHDAQMRVEAETNKAKEKPSV